MTRPLQNAEPLGAAVIRDGCVADVNDALLALFRMTRAELVGRPLAELLAAEDVARVLERHERCLRGESVPRGYEAAVVIGDGTRRMVEATVSVVQRDVFLQVRDVTARLDRRPRLVGLAQLGLDAHHAGSEPAILRGASAALARLGVASAVLRPAGDGFRVEHASAPEEALPRLARAGDPPVLDRLGRATPFLEAAWRDGRAYTDDVRDDVTAFYDGVPPAALALLAPDSCHAVCVRVDVRGKPERLLLAVGAWLREDDMGPLQLVGAHLSSAIDGVLGYADLARRNAEFGALSRIASAAGAARDLNSFFRLAAPEVTALLRCREVAAYLLDAARGEAVLIDRQGEWADTAYAYPRFPVSGTELERAVREGHAVLWRLEDLNEPARAISERHGVAAAAATPLRVRGEVIALLVVGFSRDHEPRDSDLALLDAIGAHFAAAIESQRLLGDLRERGDELSLLHELGQAVVATLELEQVLDAGVRSLARIVNVPAAYVMLPDGDQEHLVIRAASGGPADAVGTKILLRPTDHALATWTFRHLQPAAIADPQDDSRVHQGMRAHFRGTAYLSVPLVVRDRAIGSAVLVETRGRREFTAAEVARAQAIANQVAIAVENARLYEDLLQSYAELGHAQEQLVQRERLAALGELAAVVAHEVRNPLAVLFNSVGSLRRLLKPQGEVETLIDIMGEEAAHLDRIVSDLLDFARPMSPAVQSESLDRLVDDALAAALAHTQATAVQIEREREPGLPAVAMDPRLVRQAVVNVLVNALQAMPHGGTLRVRTHVEAQGDERMVGLEVSDSGVGIAGEVLARMFEPFYTTKPQGSGLGLVVVKRVVEGHQGRVSVESTPGAGTTFTIWLPTADGVATASGAP